jgi:hypothetical protein
LNSAPEQCDGSHYIAPRTYPISPFEVRFGLRGIVRFTRCTHLVALDPARAKHASGLVASTHWRSVLEEVIRCISLLPTKPSCSERVRVLNRLRRLPPFATDCHANACHFIHLTRLLTTLGHRAARMTTLLFSHLDHKPCFKANPSCSLTFIHDIYTYD